MVRPANGQACHSSYVNVCISPTGGDVDCAGGNGNGPRYVRGPVRVVGPDTYRLDRDGDGIACER
ncbi:excalibur calcium-binding domain-containing protein [Jannaschia sp. CCS1]|uniref:excalibur calcium-binding domain-containing protein n=1 Tax=Jannaschia sp. (strain CCS1) TaxID=290400 RepID=UPI000A0144BA|nr:excalibur calcium-binding domain-containing protein [Jannaschia sp. CCS1]